MKLIKTALVLAVLAVGTSAFAQKQEAGIRFLVGAPIGEFGDTVTDPGFGLAAHYGVRPIPAFTVGIGANVMIYGSESRDVSLPLVDDFELTTTNNMADGFLFAQFRPFTGPVQPYGEARLGYHYLWTESKLEDDGWWEDDEVARETNYDDFASFWSVGGGLLVQVYEADSSGHAPNVFLDFKVNYVKGAEAEYLTEDSITLVDNAPVYEASRSETDLVTYELGVVLTF